MLLPTVLLAFAEVITAAPATDLVLHETRTPATHLRRRRVEGDAILPVRIALTQSNLKEGYDYLMEISDPASPQYGKHWSVDDIHREFAPNTETIETVTSWLEEHGFDTDNIATATSKGWIGLDMPARDAERLFGTEYFEHLDTNGDVSVQCDQYHVPSHLSKHIDYVEPGIASSSPLRKAKAVRRSQAPSSYLKARSSDHLPNISPTDTSKCGEWITPACLKAMYDIPDAKYNQPENDLGVFEFYNAYDQLDLDLFYKNYAPWVPNGTQPKLESINKADGRVPQAPSDYALTEAILDFDIIFSLLYPQSVTLYQTDATNVQNKLYLKEYGPRVNATLTPQLWLPFISALDGQLCTKTERESGADCGTIGELTRVLSVSYGSSELQFPESAARRVCNEFMKLSLKGHTLLLSSGDFGVAQRPPGQGSPQLPIQNGCINPKHIENYLINGTVFNPTFPASCPWVTAVGATQLFIGDSAGDPERAMNYHVLSDPPIYSVSTGGGLSNYFPMPEYQKCAVDEYFKKYDPGYPSYVYEGRDSVGVKGGVYARGGRAFPDISANGAHMALFVNGSFVPTGEAGTSLSSPIVASMITMINQERTAIGKGPVGFLNPVIYKHPEAFTDITRGTAPGCGTKGFPVTEGWDPATGLGTPIYPKLLDIYLNLP